jgi:signal peptidase II
MTPLSRPLPALGLLALLIAADQAIKLWVEAALPLQQPIDVLPMLALFRTYNEGIAFSFLAGQSEWTLVAVTTLIVCFVVYLWRSTAPDRFFAHLGYALIVGGLRPRRRLHPRLYRDLVLCRLQPRRQLHHHRRGFDRAR